MRKCRFRRFSLSNVVSTTDLLGHIAASLALTQYGPAEFDVAHRLVASAVWQVPYTRTDTGLARLLFGGWELAPIITIQTGIALTVTQAEPFSLGGERRSRPNRIGHGALPKSERTVDRWLDASAFVPIQTNPAQAGFTPNQVFGNSGVGILRGPGLTNVDLNASKNFAITETQRIQFRAEFFNLFNHTNPGVPGINLGAGFGQIVNTATEARVIQFALKYLF